MATACTCSACFESLRRGNNACTKVQVPAEDGSQLIAHFAEDLDHLHLRETVKVLVVGELGSWPGKHLSMSVARGASTMVYITFLSYREVGQAAVDQMIGKLHRMGAKLTYLVGEEGRSGALQLQADGCPLRYTCPATLRTQCV